MTQQIINIGNSANDGSGDSLRDGASKINDNFTELYTKVNSTTNYVLPTASTAVLGGVKVDGSTIAITNGVISTVATQQNISPATALPVIDGVATVGTSLAYARQDHIHPTNVPVGVIVMWSGNTSNIPSGWFLCDGTNGTPDLRNKFIVGAGSTYSVLATGGNADATLPAHSHTATSTFTGAAHNHTVTSTVTDSGHVHGVFGNGGLGLPSGGGVVSANGSNNTGAYSAYTNAATTGITVASSSSATTATGTVATTVTSTGASATGANLPPYLALAYIMKG